MLIQETVSALLTKPGMQGTQLPSMNIPWVESPLFPQILERMNLSLEERALAVKFAEDGYLIIEVGMADFDELAAEIIRDLGDRHLTEGRISNAWQLSSAVHRLALNPHVLSLLRMLYQREPIPFHTINFGHGSMQATHSDTVHFHCIPHRFMCGVWVALEDTDADNGPLHIYPKSHALPIWDFHDFGLPSGFENYERYQRALMEAVEAMGHEKMQVHLQKGQMLIWAANLLHGGDPILDWTRTRHSQVTHCFFADCLYYVPALCEPYIGKMKLHTIVNITDGKVVPQRYNGQDIPTENAGHIEAVPCADRSEPRM